MPNIGPFELIIVLVVVLLLLGPTRLPSLANAVGRSLREFRKGANDPDAAADRAADPTAAIDPGRDAGGAHG